MRRTIPWWLKIVIKIIFSRLPINYSVWQKFNVFRHGKMDQADYAIEIFSSHITKSGFTLDNLKGKTILELGPGDSISSALLAAAFDAKSILVDADSFVSIDVLAYQTFAENLNSRGFKVPDISSAETINEILTILQAKYLTQGLKSLNEIKSSSVDLIFSEAVLEHVRKRDLFKTIQELKRVLKKSGVCSHKIDLKDHLSYSLNNLRFAKKIWESEFIANSGFYTNRVQFDPFIEMFKKVNFGVEILEIKKWENLPTSRKKMALPFRELTKKQLSVSEFHILLKPLH